MKIAVDIDGTVLTQGTPELNYRDAKPLPEMITVINELFDAGHEIYFFTARHFKHYVYTESVLKDAGFKFHGLIMNKPSCDLFIDDRGFRMDNNIDDLKSLINKLENKND
jgi:hypothetical protein